MVRRRKDLGDWQDDADAAPEVELPSEIEVIAEILPEIIPQTTAVDGSITSSGVRQIVPRVATGNEPHAHTWIRGRRPDNSQIFSCACGLERVR